MQWSVPPGYGSGPNDVVDCYHLSPIDRSLRIDVQLWALSNDTHLSVTIAEQQQAELLGQIRPQLDKHIAQCKMCVRHDLIQRELAKSRKAHAEAARSLASLEEKEQQTLAGGVEGLAEVVQQVAAARSWLGESHGVVKRLESIYADAVTAAKRSVASEINKLTGALMSAAWAAEQDALAALAKAASPGLTSLAEARIRREQLLHLGQSDSCLTQALGSPVDYSVPAADPVSAARAKEAYPSYAPLPMLEPTAAPVEPASPLAGPQPPKGFVLGLPDA
jgi:hypothetical protein